MDITIKTTTTYERATTILKYCHRTSAADFCPIHIDWSYWKILFIKELAINYGVELKEMWFLDGSLSLTNRVSMASVRISSPVVSMLNLTIILMWSFSTPKTGRHTEITITEKPWRHATVGQGNHLHSVENVLLAGQSNAETNWRAQEVESTNSWFCVLLHRTVNVCLLAFRCLNPMTSYVSFSIWQISTYFKNTQDDFQLILSQQEMKTYFTQTVNGI